MEFTATWDGRNFKTSIRRERDENIVKTQSAFPSA
jgi:hypothetical protein